MRALVFSVHSKAPNLNDIVRMKASNHHAYNGLKKRWNAAVVSACAEPFAALVECYGAPEGRARISIKVNETNRRRDPDNVIAGARKFVHDGLVSAGVIAGDGWAHIYTEQLPSSVQVAAEHSVRVAVAWPEWPKNRGVRE